MTSARFGAVEVAVVGLCLGLGIVVPLFREVSPLTVAVTVAVGLVIGAALGILSGAARGVAVLVGLLGGVAVGQTMGLPDAWNLSWSLALLAGLVVGSVLFDARSRRPGGRRSSPEPPPAGSVLLTWTDGDDEHRLEAPSAERVAAAVRALDGDRRSVVSILRGAARLDVGGDARGAMMVYESDDHTDHRTTWHHLTTPDGDADEDEVAVTIAGWPGRFRGPQTTTVDPALRAVEHFRSTGQRAPGLPWHGDRQVADMRPPALQRTDGPARRTR